MKPSDQKIFDKILEDEIRKKSRTIIDEIENDRRHLDVVNFCANIFVPGSSVDEQTGYKLIILEPLYSLHIRNFDFALFRIENASLILVECKHSVSDAKNLVEDQSYPRNLEEREEPRKHYWQHYIPNRVCLMRTCLKRSRNTRTSCEPRLSSMRVGLRPLEKRAAFV